MVNALSAQADVMRGLVRIAAQGAPAGSGVLTRRTDREVDVVRGGVFPINTGGAIVTDPEAHFGQQLLYRMVDTVTSRHIQSNRVLNPKLAVDITNWTIPSGRTGARETDPTLAPPRDAVTSLRIGPRSKGSGTLTERLLARCSPAGLTTGRWYVSGQLRYTTPNIALWADVKAAGTWATTKAKGTWGTVKAAGAPNPGQAFATLNVAVLDSTGATTVVAPFQILGAQTDANGDWATFQGYVDIPAGAPANCSLAFYQGTVDREYTITWWLTTLMVTPAADLANGYGVTPYFDGDSKIASFGDPGALLAPGYDWKALTGDASVTWQGTPNASWTEFTGPSQIFSEVSVFIGKPDAQILPRVKLPVFLSDPVAPQLAQWFELLEIGDLTYAARQQLFDVLGREAQIAVNQRRAWASGELRLMTYTLADADVAERLFQSGRILYWRNPDPRFPENGWWVAIGDTNAGRVGTAAAWAPERLWKVPFVRVERPVGLIAASSSITWGITRANYTWQQLRDAKKDWLDVALTGPSS